jgi:uncharacterized protein DUF5709
MSQTPDEASPAQPFYGQDQPYDTLDDRGVDDILDEGMSPPEKWSAGEGFGSTVEEERQGETLDQRIAQEIPDPDPYAEVDEDVIDDGEVGDERSGRLAAPGREIGEDEEPQLVGDDVGIDGGAASAEEAAVHVVEDD